MQKKIIISILIYIVLICVIGGGLLIKRQFDSIPVVDDSLIQELLDSSEIANINPGTTPGMPKDPKEQQITDSEGTGNSYWGNYYNETKNEEVDRNPVVSQIQEKISTGDKLRIMKIIKSNLSSEEIKYILSLAKSGFDSKEQLEVKNILREKIGEEEKQELKGLLLKYL